MNYLIAPYKVRILCYNAYVGATWPIHFPAHFSRAPRVKMLVLRDNFAFRATVRPACNEIFMKLSESSKIIILEYFKK